MHLIVPFSSLFLERIFLGLLHLVLYHYPTQEDRIFKKQKLRTEKQEKKRHLIFFFFGEDNAVFTPCLGKSFIDLQ